MSSTGATRDIAHGLLAFGKQVLLALVNVAAGTAAFSVAYIAAASLEMPVRISLAFFAAVAAMSTVLTVASRKWDLLRRPFLSSRHLRFPLFPSTIPSEDALSELRRLRQEYIKLGQSTRRQLARLERVRIKTVDLQKDARRLGASEQARRADTMLAEAADIRKGIDAHGAQARDAVKEIDEYLARISRQEPIATAILKELRARLAQLESDLGAAESARLRLARQVSTLSPRAW